MHNFMMFRPIDVGVSDVHGQDQDQSAVNSHSEVGVLPRRSERLKDKNNLKRVAQMTTSDFKNTAVTTGSIGKSSPRKCDLIPRPTTLYMLVYLFAMLQLG